MRVPLLALLSVAGLMIGGFPAAAAASAGADLGWGVPVPLQTSVEGNIYGVELALSATTGDTFALWYQEEGPSREGLHAARWNPAWTWPNWDTPYLLAPEGYSWSLAADAGGNAMAIFSQYENGQDSLFSSRFTAATGWGALVAVESNPGTVYGADLAMDPTGRATAAWLEWDGTRYNVWANRFGSTSGWGTPSALEADPGDATDVRVAMDASGNAMVAWRQDDGAEYNVWASRYASGSWSAPTQVESAAGTTSSLRLELDAAGNGIAFWSQRWVGYTGSFQLFASNFTPSGGWSAPVWVDQGSYSVYTGELSMNADGVAMAAWTQFVPGNGTSVLASRFVPVSGWGTPVMLESSTESAAFAGVGVDSSGNALAAWRQSDGKRSRVFQNYYTAGGSWCCAYEIDMSSGVGEPVSTPQIVFDSADNAIVAWVQSDGAFNSLYASRYDAAYYNWFTRLVEFDHDGSVSTMRLATNAQGHAAVAWTQRDSYTTYNLYANRFVPGSGWGAPTLLEMEPYSAGTPSVAVDPSGNVFVVWTQGDGSTTNVYASRYTAGGAWSTPAALESLAGSPSATRLGADASGNAIALWSQHDGVNYSLYSSRFTPAAGWGAAALVEDTTGNVGGVQLAVRPSGEAVAMWYQWDGARFRVNSASFAPASGWGTPATPETLSGDVSVIDLALNPSGAGIASWTRSLSQELYVAVLDAAQGWGSPTLVQSSSKALTGNVVAIDPMGNAMVAWGEHDGALRRVHAARWTASAGWSADTQLESSGLGDAFPSDLAMDSMGNAVLVGTQNEGARTSAIAARYVAGSGWRSPVLLESGLGDARSPSVGVDAAGNAFAAWPQSDGRHLLPWAARYTVGDGAPRLTITGPTASVTNNSHVTLSGQTDPGAAVTVDGSPATVGPAGTFSVELTPGDGTHAFEVVATNVEGASTRTTVTLRVDTAPPGVTITSPATGASVSTPTVTVRGTTEPGAAVSVNGMTATVAADGAFEVSLALHPGSNAVNVSSRDGAGNTGTASVSVTFDDPGAALEQQLAATREALNATQERAASASGMAGLAVALGAAGIAAGAVGLLMAMRGGRKPPKPEPVAPPATVPPSPAPSPPPSPPSAP